jgi:hypothetical protein
MGIISFPGERVRTSKHSRPRLSRAISFAALGAFLAYGVTAKTLSAYLANAAPERAFVVHPHQPTAILSLADQKLSELDIAKGADANSQSLASDPATNQEIRAMAESALAADPINARALRILGQLADRSHDATRALQFMQMSARFSMNESFAVAWLVDKSFEKKDYTAALHYADVLLRTRPQLINFVIPTLAQIAENNEATGELKKLLAENPTWRGGFFATLPASVSDARTPLELLAAVKESPNPPTADDLRGYLNFLIGHKFYALAYHAWLQFLPAEQLNSLGPLFNGSFETPPSGSPFDWIVTPGANVSVDFAPAPGQEGGRALVISFEQGRVDFRGITQLIMLAPGKYQFLGKYTGELTGQRGLKWRVACADAPTGPIGESGMVAGRSPTWKTLEFAFAVPNANCVAQYLRLDLDARMSSEQFASGTLWFDELRISRLADTASK